MPPLQLPNDVKLDTEIQFEMNNSCNCVCCPIFRTPKAKSTSTIIRLNGADISENGIKIGFDSKSRSVKVKVRLEETDSADNKIAQTLKRLNSFEEKASQS